MHNRAAIKAAVKTILTAQVSNAYPTDAEDRVYVSRRLPLPKEEDGDLKLPAICIYTPKEKSEMHDNLNNKRTVDIVIECHVLGSDEVDLASKINQIAAQIEDALVEDETLNDQAAELDLTLTEELESDDGDALLGGVRLTYECVYWAEKASDPGGDSFSGADVKYNGGEFSDTVQIPPPAEP